MFLLCIRQLYFAAILLAIAMIPPLLQWGNLTRSWSIFLSDVLFGYGDEHQSVSALHFGRNQPEHLTVGLDRLFGTGA